MKRDFDLIRWILQDVEHLPAGEIFEEVDYGEDYGQETINAHVELLVEAGLLKGQLFGGVGEDTNGFSISGLTWRGYDFLDAAKDDTIWAKAKGSVLKPTATFTFDLLLEWLKAQAKEKLGLP